MARDLIRWEGLLVGGSSGAAMVGAIRAILRRPHMNTPGHRVVVLLPDGLRNYLSKFASDEWMLARGFSLNNNPENDDGRDLNELFHQHVQLPWIKVTSVPEHTLLKDIVFEENGPDLIAVTTTNADETAKRLEIKGVLRPHQLLKRIILTNLPPENNQKDTCHKGGEECGDTMKVSQLADTDIIVPDDSNLSLGQASRLVSTGRPVLRLSQCSNDAQNASGVEVLDEKKLFAILVQFKQ